ncbi:MAG: hypothetical protein V3V05_05860, partial [Pontiella sp.]
GATFLLLHADAPILVCGELKKGSFWHGALDFQTGHFNLQSTAFTLDGMHGCFLYICAQIIL